jgi:hypothetical protein
MSTINTRRIGYFLIILALLAYALPWLHNPPVGLTFGVYDLAEWTSLHPAVRVSTLPLLTSLLLRIPLPCLLLGLLLAIRSQPRWLAILITLVAAATLLPPIEFVTQFRDDPNYQQQFAVALLTFISGLVAALWRSSRLQKSAALLLFVVSFTSALFGVAQAASLMEAFELPARIGSGIMLHSITSVLAAALTIRALLQNKTEQLPHLVAAPSNVSG